VKSPVPDLAGVASVAQRLAVLLAAGVAPGAAWGYLRNAEPAASVAEAVANGRSIPDAIVAASTGLPVAERAAWRGLATAWTVAADAGAPLAPTLREFSASLRDLAQAQREITVALAAPVATARLVLALPAIGILFGMVLGFNTVGTLVATPVGWACLGIGAGLMFGASRWNRRLVRSAQPRQFTPGLEFDLLAIAVSGGASVSRARASVASALDRFEGADFRHDASIDGVLELSLRAGVPAADLLHSEAAESRRTARAQAQQSAQVLSVRLMIPLGVCVLPAFMVLSVVPLLVTVLDSTHIAT
jgi:tight adherence protein B